MFHTHIEVLTYSTRNVKVRLVRDRGFEHETVVLDEVVVDGSEATCVCGRLQQGLSR